MGWRGQTWRQSSWSPSDALVEDIKKQILLLLTGPRGRQQSDMPASGVESIRHRGLRLGLMADAPQAPRPGWRLQRRIPEGQQPRRRGPQHFSGSGE